MRSPVIACPHTQVERDAADVVGLGLPMWLFLILFVLVSGVIGWATWLFLILAGVLLLFLNMVLLTSLRHMTKGGQVLRQHKVCVWGGGEGGGRGRRWAIP